MISSRRGLYANVQLLLNSGANCRTKRYDTKEDVYTIVRKLAYPQGKSVPSDVSPVLMKNILQLLETSNCK